MHLGFYLYFIIFFFHLETAVALRYVVDSLYIKPTLNTHFFGYIFAGLWCDIHIYIKM